MPLFTFILEFRGGTYVKQVRGKNVHAAWVAWARSLKPGEVQGLGPKRIEQLVRETEVPPNLVLAPVRMQGLANAWCGGCSSGLLNIVQTDPALAK